MSMLTVKSVIDNAVIDNPNLCVSSYIYILRQSNVYFQRDIFLSGIDRQDFTLYFYSKKSSLG